MAVESTATISGGTSNFSGSGSDDFWRHDRSRGSGDFFDSREYLWLSFLGRRFLVSNCTRRRFLLYRRLLIAPFWPRSFHFGGDLDNRCWSKSRSNYWFDARRSAACPLDQSREEMTHAASISR